MSKEKKSKPDRKSPGRPRSEAAKQAILEAARSLLEAHGPARLTVEAVARQAGVGKPTIYRYWANAQELAMAALVDRAPEAMENDKTGSLAGLVESIVERLNSRRGRQMALMLAGAEPDSELFKAFSNRVVLEGRARGLALLEREKADGRIAHDADTALAMDMIFGAVLLRLLLRNAPLDESIGEGALEIARHGIATERG